MRSSNMRGSLSNPHYSRRLLLHPPIRRCDKPDGGRARHSVGQHTVSSMPPSLAAPRARLAWRLGGFVTNPREYCGLKLRHIILQSRRRGRGGAWKAGETEKLDRSRLLKKAGSKAAAV